MGLPWLCKISTILVHFPQQQYHLVIMSGKSNRQGQCYSGTQDCFIVSKLCTFFSLFLSVSKDRVLLGLLNLQPSEVQVSFLPHLYLISLSHPYPPKFSVKLLGIFVFVCFSGVLHITLRFSNGSVTQNSGPDNVFLLEIS